MATFDQLSAEQRAIVELVLQQGKTYAELSELLGVPEPRVRELARDALVELAPVSVRAVEEDWRGQLADYVLGQQAGPEASATKGHLRRSEAARSWTRSLLDSLEGLYPNGSMPAVPEGERGRRASAAAKAPAGVRAGRGHRSRRQAAQAAGRRWRARRAGARGRAAVADRRPHGGRRRAGARGRAGCGRRRRRSEHARADDRSAGRHRDRGRAERQAPAARPGRPARAERPARGLRGLALQRPGRRKDARRPGHRPAGQLPGDRHLPADFEQYRFIDISREPLDKQRTHSGDSVLRGRMPTLRAAQPQGDQKTAVLGQSVLAPPGG